MGSKEDRIIAEAREYINGGKTIAETAKSLGLSKRTFQLHLGKLESIDPELHAVVLDKKTSNQNAGRRLGGMLGKRSANYTLEEAQDMANRIVTQHLTYQEAEELYNIPSSSIYDMVHSSFISSDIKEELEMVAVENQRNASIDVIQRGSSKK